MSNTQLAIRAERSRIETRQRCNRERMLGYHYGAAGLGISKRNSKYEAAFGDCVHQGLSAALMGQPYDLALAELEAVLKAVFGDQQHYPHIATEQTWLFKMLVQGWRNFRMPLILRDYTIVSLEQEYVVTFQPADYLPANFAGFTRPLEMPLRMDAVLRRKSDGLLFIMDFKTTSTASEDWNIKLDNSLQSHLYVAGAELVYKEPIGGIWYEGLVKGRRELDNARSSPFNGHIIQYGTWLYSWRNGASGEIAKQYVAGRKRVFTPNYLHGTTWPERFTALADMGWNLREFFPSTIPIKPLDSGLVIGSVIVAENNFAQHLEFYQSAPLNSPERFQYEHILFEPSLDNCFKFGAKHPCQFKAICHDNLHPDEVMVQYEPRVPHHPTT